MSLTDLEAARPGQVLRFRHDGVEHATASPWDLDFQDLLAALRDEMVPDLPRMPMWRTRVLFRRWMAHHDLPSFQHAQRLCYLLDRYYDEIEYDLRTTAQEDAGALWRARQWRYLLNLIDHLPPNCWYTHAISNDEEHARMMAEAMEASARDGDGEAPTPPIKSWDQHAAMLADLIDATRAIPQALVAANGGKPKDIPPYPRPRTALEKAQKQAQYKARKARHERLVERMLGKARREAPAAPALPPGWRYDAAGRLRNARGQYAKKPS